MNAPSDRTHRLPARIVTERLVLRAWTAADVPALNQAVVDNLEHLRPWMYWIAEEPVTAHARRQQIERWNREWADGGDALFGVFREDTVVGGGGLHRRGGPATLEIGYWIHRDHTRNGYATEASRGMTTAAFEVPGIEHVEIHHDKANVASEGVPRRLGYRLVAEQPRRAVAPAEFGVERQWRMSRADWDLSGLSSERKAPDRAD